MKSTVDTKKIIVYVNLMRLDLRLNTDTRLWVGFIEDYQLPTLQVSLYMTAKQLGIKPTVYILTQHVCHWQDVTQG